MVACQDLQKTISGAEIMLLPYFRLELVQGLYYMLDLERREKN